MIGYYRCRSYPSFMFTEFSEISWAYMKLKLKKLLFVVFYSLSFREKLKKNRSPQLVINRKIGEVWKRWNIPNKLMNIFFFFISVQFSNDLPVFHSTPIITKNNKFFMFQALQQKMVSKIKERATLNIRKASMIPTLFLYLS